MYMRLLPSMLNVMWTLLEPSAPDGGLGPVTLPAVDIVASATKQPERTRIK